MRVVVVLCSCLMQSDTYDIVNWDVNELDKVANQAHNDKPQADSTANLDEFWVD